MRTERRGHWYLLTGLLLGLGLGLLTAWVISPVQYTNTDPSSLSAPYQEAYRKVIALAYQSNQDLGRARERLSLLEIENPSRELAAQAQRMVAADDSPKEAGALAVLARDLGQNQPVGGSTPTAGGETAVAAADGTTLTPAETTLPPTETPDFVAAIQTPTRSLPTNTPDSGTGTSASLTPESTPTTAFTATPRPTATETPIFALPFKLMEKAEVCHAQTPGGLVQIEVTDSVGAPMPGVRVVVTWEGKEEIFYTGLAPEVSVGYADFQMQPGIVYSVMAGSVSDKAEVQTPDCGGGWKLWFIESAP